MLRVFVAQLTKYLNLRSPIYYVLHICKKNSKEGRQYSLYVVLHPITSQSFHIERSKNVLYVHYIVMS
jgi:hypothetical protein